MPLVLEPGQEIEVWLDIDDDKPEDVRPVFIAKAQSVRGQRRIDHLVSAWSKPEYFGEDIDKLYDEAIDLLCDLLVGWRNMGQWQFNRESIEDVLSYSEIRELIRKIQAGNTIRKDQKKS